MSRAGEHAKKKHNIKEKYMIPELSEDSCSISICNDSFKRQRERADNKQPY
jgi:hypothetical protein